MPAKHTIQRPETPLSDPPVARVEVPPPPRERLKMYGGLVLVVLVVVPVWFVALGQPQVVQSREATLLQSARETALRDLENEHEPTWLLPTLHNEYRFNPPPMSVWLQMLAWRDLDVRTAPAETLVYRARLLALFMGLLALMSTYWAGKSIGDIRTARLAALALGTTLLFVDQVRTACVETHMLAWVTLAVAAGLWAMRPLKDVNWVGRRVLGWFIAGLALACATLTMGIGPAVLYVLPPLFAAILLTPRRRLDNLIGLSFAVILGFIAAAPWHLYVLDKLPGTEPAVFFQSLLPPRDIFLITWSHARVLVVLSPWIVWLLGAMFQPFIRAEHERRRQLLIAWFWFLMVFVFVSIPASRSVRQLWPLLPAAGLLVGQLWAFHAQLSSERKEDPGVDWLRVPHWLALGLASILGPAMLAMQPRLIEERWLKEPLLADIAWPVAAAMGAMLLLIALLGTRWHFKWRPRAAAYATVAWMLLALAVCLPYYTRLEDLKYNRMTDAQRLGAAVPAGAELYYLRSNHHITLDSALFFYAGRTVQPLTLDQVPDALAQEEPFWLICTANPADEEALLDAGFTVVLEFADTHAARKLYHKPQAAADERAAR